MSTIQPYRDLGKKFVLPLMLCVTAPLQADEGAVVSVTDISGQAISHVAGSVAVNQASGNDNLQSNVRALALSRNGGAARATIQVGQYVENPNPVTTDMAVSRIGDAALHSAHGLISVNQASGGQNMQLNVLAIVRSNNAAVSDKTLAELSSDAPVARSDITSDTMQRKVLIEGTAFVGTTGIAQVNQAAGVGNITSNRIEMMMHLE